MKTTLVPALKDFDCFAHDPIDQWAPGSEEDVCYHLCLHVGSPETEGADCFYVQIVTPQAITGRNLGNRLNKHHLVVNPYSWKTVLQRIGEILTSCEGENWDQVSRLLSRHFDWEFESPNR